MLADFYGDGFERDYLRQRALALLGAEHAREVLMFHRYRAEVLYGNVPGAGLPPTLRFLGAGSLLQLDSLGLERPLIDFYQMPVASA